MTTALGQWVAMFVIYGAGIVPVARPKGGGEVTCWPGNYEKVPVQSSGGTRG